MAIYSWHKGRPIIQFCNSSITFNGYDIHQRKETTLSISSSQQNVARWQNNMKQWNQKIHLSYMFENVFFYKPSKYFWFFFKGFFIESFLLLVVYFWKYNHGVTKRFSNLSLYLRWHLETSKLVRTKVLVST